MGYGVYGMFDGAEYRWHQIGVDLTEWDDAVHTQNDTHPPWSRYQQVEVNPSPTTWVKPQRSVPAVSLEGRLTYFSIA